MPGASENTPVVSVIIPSYKRVSSIMKSIDSALAQTVRDIEVIVIDDASQDGTVELVRDIDDDRVVLLEHEYNKGANAARALGIAHARGEWVAFLDSDDQWLPTKLQRQLELLESLGDDYGLCTTWLTIVGPQGEFLRHLETSISADAYEVLQCSNPLGSFSSAIIRRAAVLEVGSVNVSLPACQDWDLFARVSRIVKVCIVPEHLVLYLADPGDRTRITTSNRKVIGGLQHMYTNMRRQYPTLSPRMRRTGTRYFGEKFANEGAVRDVARVALGTLRPTQIRDSAFAGHMLVRSIRKAVRAANAEQSKAAEAAKAVKAKSSSGTN